MYYDPPEKGRPGVLEENKSYVFKYPRPPKCAHAAASTCSVSTAGPFRGRRLCWPLQPAAACLVLLLLASMRPAYAGGEAHAALICLLLVAASAWTHQTLLARLCPGCRRPRALRIYECHVGMSSQEPKVGAETVNLSCMAKGHAGSQAGDYLRFTQPDAGSPRHGPTRWRWQPRAARKFAVRGGRQTARRLAAPPTGQLVH